MERRPHRVKWVKLNTFSLVESGRFTQVYVTNSDDSQDRCQRHKKRLYDDQVINWRADNGLA